MVYSFKWIQLMVGWLQGRNGVVEGHGRAELFNPWQPGAREGGARNQSTSFQVSLSPPNSTFAMNSLWINLLMTNYSAFLI